jgi:hypothetical protein
MEQIKRIFSVDGKPFFPIGGQTRNSSGYGETEWATAFRALDLLHGNTLEIPVYWEQVEPEEGIYDFAHLDALIAEARSRDVRLILLWFGTWKNGNMEYVPAWVKQAPDRFRRVVPASGSPLWVLSSHCQATLDADRRVFVKLCEHLSDRDGAQRTVIALQIENEPGILGADRDYGPRATESFESAVPASILSHLAAGEGGPVHALWQETGATMTGTWAEVFGDAAGELFSAWSIARYIDSLAAAGKAAYDLPMYLNVWLGETGWQIPGESYPSGGAVSKALDLYKWATPHVDLVAPDIYLGDLDGYNQICQTYGRFDNPLFIPESAPGGSNAVRVFQAVGNHNAIGYAFFGIEHAVGADGEIEPDLLPLVESFRCIAAAIPLLLAYQGSPRIHVVAQEADLGVQTFDFEGYRGLVNFGRAGPMDWRHRRSRTPGGTSPGRGLIVQTARHEFYLVGGSYHLHLRLKSAPATHLQPAQTNDRLLTRLAHYVRVDEGHFDAERTFIVDRRRNGDETDNGIWVEPDVGVVRVELCE